MAGANVSSAHYGEGFHGHRRKGRDAGFSAPNRPHKSTMAEGSGLMERTAVKVRTGTIRAGNAVDTTSTGHLVSVIVECQKHRHLV